jgi:hypothetical protein
MEMIRNAKDIEVAVPPDVYGSDVSANLKLSELILSRENLTGRKAAVFIADLQYGDGLLLDRPVQFLDPATILKWLTRIKCGDDAKPTLVMDGFEKIHIREPDPTAGPPQLLVGSNGRNRVLTHLGIEEPSGLIKIKDGDPDGAVASEIGGKQHPSEPGVYLIDQARLATFLVAAVFPFSEAPTDFGKPRPDFPSEPMPMDLYQPEVQRFVDPRNGAPLEVVWNTLFKFSGIPHLCLINTENQADVIRIPYRLSLAGPDFMVELGACLEMGATPLLGITTGFGGHCVTLSGISDGRVLFMDPWGGRSMLCAENNSLGVSAQREREYGQNFWSVSTEELIKAACAAFINPETWSDHRGANYSINIADVLAADFGKFFHIRELERRPLSEHLDAVHFKTGGFKPYVDIWCTLLPGGEVAWSSLRLARKWLESPPNRSFAADIALGFLKAFLPDPDQTDALPLMEALKAVMHGDPKKAQGVLQQGPPHLKIPMWTACATFGGTQEASAVPMFMSNLMLRNVDQGEGGLWFVLDVVTGVARPSHTSFDPDPLPLA